MIIMFSWTPTLSDPREPIFCACLPVRSCHRPAQNRQLNATFFEGMCGLTVDASCPSMFCGESSQGIPHATPYQSAYHLDLIFGNF